jgi:hypothetical protein
VVIIETKSCIIHEGTYVFLQLLQTHTAGRGAGRHPCCFTKLSRAFKVSKNQNVATGVTYENEYFFKQIIFLKG